MKIISEELWNQIKEFLPANQNMPRKRGRPTMSPRRAISGIIYVLENACKWRCLPGQFGKSTTVHGTYMRWLRNGTFKLIFEQAREYYLSTVKPFPLWLAIDSSSSKAPLADWSGKNPTDRSKMGIKKNIIIDQYGMPLALVVGAANRHDSTFFKETIDALMKINSSNIVIMEADSAYDSNALRGIARDKGILLYAATNRRRNMSRRILKPGFRWMVERSQSWMHQFRSLKTCWVKKQDSFLGFAQLAASILLFNKIRIFG